MSIVVSKTRLPVTEWQTASGSIVSISDARKRNAKSLSVALEPIQDLHGYANPWVGGAGKNLVDEANCTIYRKYFCYSGGNYYWTKSSDSSSVAIPCKPNTTYTISVGVSNVTILRAGTINVPADSAQDGTQIYNFNVNGSSSNPITITTDAYSETLVVQVNNSILQQRNALLQIEIGSTATAYEPYENLCPISGHSAVTLNHAGASQSDNPTSVTVQLGQTVYGGTVDLVSGVGTVTNVADDLSLLSWTTRKTGTVNKFLSATLSNYFKPKNSASPIGMIAEDYVDCGSSNASELQTNIETASVGLYSYKTSSARSNTIYAVIANDSSPSGKVVYPLATPITYQLSPNQIQMLERYNTIWAEEGDISVTYARIHS